MFGQSPETAAGWVGELGCVACHEDTQITSGLRERAPELGSAGLRYQPAYLFDFLRNPVRVRRHLGRARMPDFHLTEPEAVALVAFLGEQRQVTGSWPQLPAALLSLPDRAGPGVSGPEFRSAVTRDYLCLNCHILEGTGGAVGVELSNIGYRLQAGWVKRYLAAPSMFGVGEGIMPAQFYRLAADGRAFEPLVAEPERKIQFVTDYLFSLQGERRAALEKRYRAAREAHPTATAERGTGLFRALQCAACHRHPFLQPPGPGAAPPLRQLGWGVRPRWLETYLRQPTAVRPFGYPPGQGNRMPDFGFSEAETTGIAAFLLRECTQGPPGEGGFKPQRLSAFSRRKAEGLLRDRFACLGCHRLGDEGGRIGPELSDATRRRMPEYIYGIIKNPQAIRPHSVMPQPPLAESTVQLLANYLVQAPAPDLPVATVAAQPMAGYLSPLDHPVLVFGPQAALGPGRDRARRNYVGYCAPCHGPEGQGDGFNVPFLPVAPTRHADPAHMSQRPDDTLYDGIHAGGLILNKSARMPSWQGTLSSAEIKELVAYLRTLCQCQGPAWSQPPTPQP